MKALVYHGPGKKSWEEVPTPDLQAETDAIVRVDAVTICGTCGGTGSRPIGSLPITSR